MTSVSAPRCRYCHHAPHVDARCGELTLVGTAGGGLSTTGCPCRGSSSLVRLLDPLPTEP